MTENLKHKYMKYILLYILYYYYDIIIITSCPVYLNKEQNVQHFGLSLAVLLPQDQHVQHAGSHALPQVGQARLQLGHRVHPALAVLHHLREEKGEGVHAHFGLGSAQRPLQNHGLGFGEARLHCDFMSY